MKRVIVKLEAEQSFVVMDTQAEMNLHKTINNALRDLCFGRPNRGEPAYKDEPTFHSTYPKGYLPQKEVEAYNAWIRGIHEQERKKFFNGKEILSKKRKDR